MTNAEKYLKDNVIVDEFINEYADYYVDETVKRPVVIRENMKKFLQEEAKSTLTEDERVILRNIDKDYKYIGRKRFLGQEYMYVSQKENGTDFSPVTPLEHLFQFIKERRRIRDKGVTKQ